MLVEFSNKCKPVVHLKYMAVLLPGCEHLLILGTKVHCKERMSVSADIVNGCVMT